MVLSAAQILMILQERPEVVVELKSYLADMLQQQGTPTQPDSITDEMLYNQISTSPQVRAGITVFLRSRGFVSDEDLQRAAMTSGQSSPPSGASETELPLTTGSPFGSQIQSTQEESPFAASLPSEINTPSPTRADSKWNGWPTESKRERDAHHNRRAAGASPTGTIQLDVDARSLHADSELAGAIETFWVGSLREPELGECNECQLGFEHDRRSMSLSGRTTLWVRATRSTSACGAA